MWNENIKASGPSDIRGIALNSIWNVQADKSYDVATQRQSDKTAQPSFRHGAPSLIGLRTLEGTGRVYLGMHDDVVEVSRNTVLIADWHHIRRYHTRGDCWNFWWFEFVSDGPLLFPLHKTLEIPVLARERRLFRDIVAHLSGSAPPQRCLASALFGGLLYDWLARWDGQKGGTPYRGIIEAVIERMHENLSQCWSVRAMAEAAHMGERNFRQIFRQETGQGPKAFYDKLRLAAAETLLRSGQHSVAEVAYLLNFSSPFHLTKSFVRHFGLAPSELKVKTRERR